jgi:hypothetical protein
MNDTSKEIHVMNIYILLKDENSLPRTTLVVCKNCLANIKAEYEQRGTSSDSCFLCSEFQWPELPPNLDALPLSHLSKLAGVFDLLSKYSRVKQDAMISRENGDIQSAMLLEAKLEELYWLIPKKYRW